MADKGKGDANKKKEKKKRVILPRPSLINRGETSGPEPPLKRMQTVDTSGSVTVSEVPSKIMDVIPMASLLETVPEGSQAHVEIDFDKELPGESL